jgi:hypothetical protein
MKNKILSLMLLVIVSGMYAQVSENTQNISDVLSLGDDNISTVLQIGDNDSEVIQHGDGNESEVSQSGLLNISVVHQGYYPGPYNWRGNDNTASLTQDGNNNDSHIDQQNYGEEIASGNNATMSQIGNRNILLSQQNTDNNIVTVNQTGDRNDSFTKQYGSNTNISYIFQISPIVGTDHDDLLNDSDVVQEGNDNENTVNQTATDLGVKNFSDVHQEGSFLTSMVTQYGITNSSAVKQYGWNHNSTVNQNGARNTSNVLQQIGNTTTLTH